MENTDDALERLTDEAQGEDTDEQQPLENEYIYDNTTTEFCNNLFEELERTTSSRIFWKQIKPLIRGKIPYTPDTPVVRRILKEVRYILVHYIYIV